MKNSNNNDNQSKQIPYEQLIWISFRKKIIINLRANAIACANVVDRITIQFVERMALCILVHAMPVALRN